MNKLIEFIGKVSQFGSRVIVDLFRPPFEGGQIIRYLAEAGSKSLPLVISSGFALGTVMTLHTRSTLVMFGAGAMIPAVQALAFFVEIGPLVAGLLLAGRVGSGIGAVLANMRATEQIDSIESLSIDSFKFLVVPRVVACVLALPLLTLFMDFSDSNGQEQLSAQGRAILNGTLAQDGDSIVESPIVIEGYQGGDNTADQLASSRQRAILVRQYLQTHFQLDPGNLGAVSMMNRPPSGLDHPTWDGICIVVVKVKS